MQTTDIEKLRFPIGKYHFPETLSPETLTGWIKDIEELPSLLKAEVDGLDEATLQRRYRPEGWTIHQVVHHLADSHINSIVRIKLAITNDNPTINPYPENLWAELPDSLELPISTAINILDGIHAKMAVLLKSLTPEKLQRTFVHPEYNRTQTLEFTIGLYAWHGRHHLEHIKLAKANGF